MPTRFALLALLTEGKKVALKSVRYAISVSRPGLIPMC
jgi:hypothetical protein